MRAFENLLLSGSGSSCLSKAVILMLLCGVVPSTKAQDKGDFNLRVKDQLKDVTGTGPYPIYLRAQPLLFSIANTDAMKCFQVYDKYEGGLTTPKTMWGFNADLGFRFRKWFWEIGFTQMGRKSKDHELSLRVREQFAALRLGYALSIYYPISFQFSAGYVTSATDIILTDPSSTIPKRKLGFGESALKGRSGMEVGARFVLMDPVGSGGGLGITIECRLMHFFDSLDYSPFARILNDTATETITSDNTFGIFSIGIIAPIAYRLNTSATR